jgi:hypothetical protein
MVVCSWQCWQLSAACHTTYVAPYTTHSFGAHASAAALCLLMLHACRTQQDRRSLEQLETEKQMCNLISKYTPEYVRSRALESPGAAVAVMVRSCCSLSQQQHVL